MVIKDITHSRPQRELVDSIEAAPSIVAPLTMILALVEMAPTNRTVNKTRWNAREQEGTVGKIQNEQFPYCEVFKISIALPCAYCIVEFGLCGRVSHTDMFATCLETNCSVCWHMSINIVAKISGYHSRVCVRVLFCGWLARTSQDVDGIGASNHNIQV